MKNSLPFKPTSTKVLMLLVCWGIGSSTLNAGEPTQLSPFQAELNSDLIFHETISDCYFDPLTADETRTRIDSIQIGLNIGICQAARWIDSRFGDTHAFHEEDISGRVALGIEYSRYDGFDYSSRFHIRAPLNNLNNKLNVFFGRVDENTYLRDTQPDLPGAFRDGIFGEDNSWLLGLGYRTQSNRNRGFSISVGAKLLFEPYVKARYRYNRSFNEKQFMRFRQTAFWRSERGFGTTSRLNLFHKAGPDSLLRWDSTLTIAEDIEGVKWYTGGTLYHRIHGNHALSTQLFIQGETGKEADIQDYGLHMVIRRPVGRDWLFIEAGPSVTWPRERFSEKRKISLGFSLLVEMQFGDYKY
ncbi:MAG: hypothetical protein L3J22_00395 [Xanthomonadales bacterium]|nr:hypothetical protein [Xanthomonadales bacterium]